ncbi:MAG: hypothetical protein KDD60_09240, partial [Bdellovibrionales bacterium]|nr:hypothetical protein [Bdellovibrionales bacterium]
MLNGEEEYFLENHAILDLHVSPTNVLYALVDADYDAPEHGRSIVVMNPYTLQVLDTILLPRGAESDSARFVAGSPQKDIYLVSDDSVFRVTKNSGSASFERVYRGLEIRDATDIDINLSGTFAFGTSYGDVVTLLPSSQLSHTFRWFNIPNVSHRGDLFVSFRRTPYPEIYEVGDLNLDGELSEFDLPEMVRAILDAQNYTHTYGQAPSGDLNGDHQITIEDGLLLVDLLPAVKAFVGTPIEHIVRNTYRSVLMELLAMPVGTRFVGSEQIEMGSILSLKSPDGLVTSRLQYVVSLQDGVPSVNISISRAHRSATGGIIRETEQSFTDTTLTLETTKYYDQSGLHSTERRFQSGNGDDILQVYLFDAGTLAHRVTHFTNRSGLHYRTLSYSYESDGVTRREVVDTRYDAPNRIKGRITSRYTGGVETEEIAETFLDGILRIQKTTTFVAGQTRSEFLEYFNIAGELGRSL